MTQIEMDFYNFVRQLNFFFRSKIVSEAIAQTTEKNRRSVVAEVTAVRNSISALVLAMDTIPLQKQNVSVLSVGEVQRIAKLNPFWFMDVWIDTSIVRSTEIKGAKMNMKEATKLLAM